MWGTGCALPRIGPGSIGYADHRETPLLPSSYVVTTASLTRAIACVVIIVRIKAAATCLRVCACVHSGRATLGLGETLAGHAKALFRPLVRAHKAWSG